MQQQEEKKKQLDRVILYARSVGVKIDGDLFFTLAYKSANELKKIADAIDRRI